MLFTAPLTMRRVRMAWNGHRKIDLILNSRALGVIGGMHLKYTRGIASTCKFFVQNLKAGVQMQTG